MSNCVGSQRVKARVRQFTLRTVIVSVMVCALVLVFVVLSAQSQRRSRQWVESQRGHVVMTPDYRLQGGWYMAPGHCPLPKLIVNTVGIDFFVTVDSVELDCEEIHDLSGMTGFARVENLYVNQFVHDVGAFEVLRDLPRLRAVTLTKSWGLTTDEVGLISNSLKGVDVVAE